MLEKPNLTDQALLTAVNKAYDLAVDKLTFLPLGNDATAWVYRVETRGQSTTIYKTNRS